MEKSFPNLDPWVFSYNFPGPLIHVNDDNLIVVEAGTQTTDLWFTVAYPSALNLTFKPDTSLFNFYPQVIKLSLTDLRSKFRISVPEMIPAGFYYVGWICNSNEYYTPVKKSLVQVTKVRNIRITVAPLTQIPLSKTGTTLNQLVSIDFAPDLGVEVTIQSFTNTIIVDPPTVTLTTGANNGTFRLICNLTEY